MTSRLSSVTGRPLRAASLFAWTALAWLSACGNDDPAPGPTNTGQTCSTVDTCYPDVDRSELSGDAVCLDRVDGGYCTHHCARDLDCCAAEGECPGGHAEVCGPFESTGEMYCFLSCEDEDLVGTDLTDVEVYCQTYAGPAFHCRSTGGGSENRKVCVP